MNRYVVAVDIGTTSTKVAVIDKEGRIHASSAIEYPLHTPAPDRAEQDPYEILRSASSAVHRAMSQASLSHLDIRCVSLSSAMHSLIALDREGIALTPCLTWADNRSAAYVLKLQEQHDAHAIYRATGTPVHPMSPLLKLMWLREQRPDLYMRTYKFVSIKEFITYHWCNVFVIDQSIASATGLYALRDRDWYMPSLTAAGIAPEQLSTLVPTTHILQGIERTWADQLGLSIHTPVVIGASDGVLANVGVGAVRSDTFAVSIGSSGAVRAMVHEPTTDPLERTFCYALTEDRWVIGGAINNGGILFRWVRDELATQEAEEARIAGIDPYERLTALARDVPAGSGGLIVLPLFAGERAPYWNADVRGVFFGLSLAHGKKHMIRAVLEGIGYAIRSVAESVQFTTGKPLEIRASGGFARSPFWRQTLADILGTRLSVPNSIESSALGAAALGLYALGDLPSLEAAENWSEITDQHVPHPANQIIYDELYAMYTDVYTQLVEPFARISAFQKNNS